MEDSSKSKRRCRISIKNVAKEFGMYGHSTKPVASSESTRAKSLLCETTLFSHHEFNIVVDSVNQEGHHGGAS